MHSSYALASSEFRVERNGDTAQLAALWPDGLRPDDRLAVVLAQPMDACGCANLICATNTLFYDHLRATRGPGNFFRYADTFLIGVGCEPGDFNQLDVWPLHKFISILQPSAEAVLETINDRRITLLALPETGARCRGAVVLSTWNTFLDTVRCVVTYSPRTGKARAGDITLVGNRVVESYVEQAIFSTPGIGAGEQARLRRLRRNLDVEPMRCAEQYHTLAGAASARALVGVTEVLPPGHQELTRRATPTTIIPIPQALAPLDAMIAPLEPALAAPDTPTLQAASDTLMHTAFDATQRRMGGSFTEWEGWDWISDFGDPIAEHHAVREAVGIWDESPLRKWVFSGRDALSAADYCFANDMASLAVGQARYGPFVDEAGRMLGDGVVFNPGEHLDGVLVVTALATDADHFRRITADRFGVEISEATERWPHLQVQGPRSRELLSSLADADISALRYFRFLPQAISIGGVGGCIVSRTGYSGELGYEVFCPPENAEALWQVLLDQGASLGIRPYGLAAVESLRIESGLIFLGYDYFPGATSPFHMNLDRTINLGSGDFHGKEALARELEAGITHRMTTLVVAGDEPPPYGADVYRHGRAVGKLLSPSAGRSPTVEQLIGLACIEADLVGPGTRLDVALDDGRLAPARVDTYPIYDPEKTRPRA